MRREIKVGDSIYSAVSDDHYLDTMGDDFEPHMVQLFRALISPDDVVADIGANIGLTALLFASLARKIYSFEPSPSTYKILTENITSNSITNVETVNLGLGQHQESLTITFSANNRSGGFVSDKIRPKANHITEQIQIDTLDNYFANEDSPPTFLKIDVEGFEQSVINGGRNLLQSSKPTVVMEMNHFCLNVLQRITIPDFIDFMKSFFPNLYAVDADNATVVDLHVPEQAYTVMYEHVVNRRFPNIVGGFDPKLKTKLDTLAKSSRPASREGKISALRSDKKLNAGDTIEVSVRLTNESQEIWRGYGDQPVLLSYHWRNSDESNHIYEGLRTSLKCQNLMPGESTEQKMTVLAPNEKGDFKLILTVVEESVCWFDDRGFECASLDVEII